ncbi:hypothetical protein HDU98_008692 [Podochytrium sp. JEL0797]|nr:hypothetical protein HDU98_008692 [Podochytrium sp. JEL0797]
MKRPRKEQRIKKKQDEYESDDDEETAPLEDQEGEGDAMIEDALEDVAEEAEAKEIPKNQSKLAYAMSRILGGDAVLAAAEAEEDSDEKPKPNKLRKENPILSRHKNIEVALDDQKLEEKAKRLLSKEKKIKTLDVARVKREDLIATNDLEKRLKKVSTRGVVKLFNAIRVAQKSVESVKSDGVQKNSAKLAALSQGGFMQMIKEPDVAKPSSSKAAAAALLKTEAKGKSAKAAAPADGGGVPWINDEFMLNPAVSAERAWDMDSD